MTDLTMKGTKGRDCSPRQAQLKGFTASKPPTGVEYTDAGTPLGGTAPEAKGSAGGRGQGVLDPATFNVDGHAVRVFSRYWEGKRSGPDWLHKRVEAAESKRWESSADPMLSNSLPKRRRL